MLRLVSLIFALSVAVPARAADDPFCLVKAGDCALGCDPLDGSCLFAPLTRFVGLHLAGGMSLWPNNVGGAFTLGIAHNRRFGAQFDLSIPDGDGGLPRGSLVRAHASVNLRVTALREGLSDPWPADGAPPTVALVVAGLAGFGNADMIGPDPFGPLFGASAEVLFWGWIYVALRPQVFVAVTDDSSAVVPFMTVSLGFTPGAYALDAPKKELGGPR